MVVPFPSCPSEFEPQHFTPPVVVRAQVLTSAAEMAATPLVSPETSTGTSDSVVVPLPSWPTSFRPQHFTPPAVVSAQAWLVLAEIATTPLVSPETSTGVVDQQ